MSGLILPNRRQFSYETLLREVNQSITFLRCWSSDHELLFLKRVACIFLNSRSSGSDTRGNCNGRPSLYDFIKSPKERERLLLSFVAMFISRACAFSRAVICALSVTRFTGEISKSDAYALHTRLVA